MQFIVNPQSLGEFSEDLFYEFCINNKELKIERNSRGQWIIMPPTGLDTSFYNLGLGTQVYLWNQKHQLGKVSDSNGGYTLPNGAIYAPDVAWVSNERLANVPEEDRKKFAHVCPNFVIELMSESDSLKQAKDKMEEWMENGTQLGWLIDPQAQKVYIYRENGERIIQDFSQKLSGEGVLPAFELNLSEIFKEST